MLHLISLHVHVHHVCSTGIQYAVHDYKKKSVVGIEINASHLQSIKEGLVYGRAEPFRNGRTMQVWNINITDKKNNLICTSRLTLAVINKK